LWIERDNVVYWKTKRKINDDLQLLVDTLVKKMVEVMVEAMVAVVLACNAVGYGDGVEKTKH